MTTWKFVNERKIYQFDMYLEILTTRFCLLIIKNRDCNEASKKNMRLEWNFVWSHMYKQRLCCFFRSVILRYGERWKLPEYRTSKRIFLTFLVLVVVFELYNVSHDNTTWYANDRFRRPIIYGAFHTYRIYARILLPTIHIFCPWHMFWLYWPDWQIF